MSNTSNVISNIISNYSRSNYSEIDSISNYSKIDSTSLTNNSSIYYSNNTNAINSDYINSGCISSSIDITDSVKGLSLLWKIVGELISKDYSLLDKIIELCDEYDLQYLMKNIDLPKEYEDKIKMIIELRKVNVE